MRSRWILWMGLVLAGIGIGFLVSSWDRTSGENGDEGRGRSIAPGGSSAATLQGNPRDNPNGQGAPAEGGPAPGLVPIEVVATSVDGAKLRLRVFAGATHPSMAPVGEVVTGTPKVVHVPPTATLWAGYVLPGEGEPSPDGYQDPTADLPSVVANAKVVLNVTRGSSQIRVTARNLAGQPVALVELELAKAPRPLTTRRLTDDEGVAVWDGIRSNYLIEEGVVVVTAPGGMTVITAPRLEVTRPAGSWAWTATGEVVLDRCAGALKAPVRDIRSSVAYLEWRTSAGAWESVSERGFYEVVPEGTPENVKVPPISAEPGERPEPLPGVLRASNLCPGEYRVQVLDAVAGFLEATVQLARNEEVFLRPQDFRTLASVRVKGYLRGPAAGLARGAELQIVDAVAPAAHFKGRALGIAFGRDGSFACVLPEGVRRISVRGSGKAPAPYWIIEERVDVARGLELRSTPPATLSGRLVDGAGAPVAGVVIGAQAEAIDARGFLVPFRVAVGSTETDKDGRWVLGPGPAGVWHLNLKADSGAALTRAVSVAAGAQLEVGDIVRTADARAN